MVYTPAEQLTVAADFLRNAEAAHYRLSQLPTQDPTKEQRLAEAEAEVIERQAEFKALKAKADPPEAPPAAA